VNLSQVIEILADVYKFTL